MKEHVICSHLSIVSAYSDKLQESTYPKLLLFAEPGGLITAPMVEWSKSHLQNLTTVSIGPGLHYVQEDNPDGIGRAIAEWIDRI